MYTSLTACISIDFVRWSNDNDDKYFAFIGKNAIHVYEVQSYSFKKYLQIDDVKDFSWSPADPVIALFVSELKFGNQHARVRTPIR